MRKAVVPEMEGPLSYPRRNGEPVFEAPWQSRAFGMVVGLHTAGLYEWEDFKRLLIEEIAATPAGGTPTQPTGYYHSWMDAFSRLLLKRNILSEDEIRSRVRDFETGVRQDVY